MTASVATDDVMSKFLEGMAAYARVANRIDELCALVDTSTIETAELVDLMNFLLSSFASDDNDAPKIIASKTVFAAFVLGVLHAQKNVAQTKEKPDAKELVALITNVMSAAYADGVNGTATPSDVTLAASDELSRYLLQYLL